MSSSSPFKSISPASSASRSARSAPSTLAASSFVSSTQSSEATSLQSAEALVWSNFGLSAFDYPLNRENRNKVQSHLNDLTFEIVAVWVVARPLNGKKHTKLKVHTADRRLRASFDRTFCVISLICNLQMILFIDSNPLRDAYSIIDVPLYTALVRKDSSSSCFGEHRFSGTRKEGGIWYDSMFPLYMFHKESIENHWIH